MIFEALNDAADAGELLLVEGGMCHFHRRRDGQVTIREVIVLPSARREGVGRRMIKDAAGAAELILARCPADLIEGNAFWSGLGFRLARKEQTRLGRVINVWEKNGPISCD